MGLPYFEVWAIFTETGAEFFLQRLFFMYNKTEKVLYFLKFSLVFELQSLQDHIYLLIKTIGLQN